MDEEEKKLLDAEIDTSLEDDLGEIHVADEVLCIVASLAAQEVPGVYSMSGGITDEINSFLGKEDNASKGVRLKYEGKQVHVIVYVNLEYGYCFPEVALAVQEKVKKAVEDMTTYEVQYVDVHVEGVFKPLAPKCAENVGSTEAMAEIMQAQAKRAEATDADSYEMQLRQNTEGTEVAVQDEEESKREQAYKHLESIARAVECEEVAYPERKYFQIGEKDTSVSAEERHRKFWEED